MDTQEYLSVVSKACGELSPQAIELAVNAIYNTYQRGGRVYTCGNGGSSATASHLANDLSKLTRDGKHPLLAAMCLSDNTPLLTAWSNDDSYTDALARIAAPWLQTPDILICISASGNSPNILAAANAAAGVGARIIGIGKAPSALAKTAGIFISTPCENICQVEDLQSVICHAIAWQLKERIAGNEKGTTAG